MRYWTMLKILCVQLLFIMHLVFVNTFGGVVTWIFLLIYILGVLGQAYDMKFTWSGVTPNIPRTVATISKVFVFSACVFISSILLELSQGYELTNIALDYTLLVQIINTLTGLLLTFYAMVALPDIIILFFAPKKN